MATAKKIKPAPGPDTDPADPAPAPVFPVDPAPEPDTTPAEAAPAKPVAPILLVTTAAPAAKEVTTMDETLMTLLSPLGLSQQTMEILVAQRLTTLSAFEGITKADLTGQGVKLGDANLIANAIAAANAPVTPATPVAPTTAAPITAIFPAVPVGDDWLKALKTSGELKKATTTDVIAGIRLSIAQRVGLYELPARLVALMDRFMKEQDEPAGAEYVKLRRELLRKRYADVLQALDYPSDMVTEAEKRELLERIDTYLWPALRSFSTLLGQWMDEWQKTMPNMLLSNMLMSQGAGLPSAMIQPPDTSALHDSVEALNNQLNKVFAHLGIYTARAMAAEAHRTLELLDTPGLMTAVGVTTKDMLLKAAGLDVQADLVRMENSVVKFAVGVLSLRDVASGQAEWQYLMALFSLASQIPWDRVTADSITAKESRRASGSGFPNSGAGPRI